MFQTIQQWLLDSQCQVSKDNKTPTQVLTLPAEKKIDKIDTYYATAQAGVNIKVAIIFILFLT